MRTLPFFAILLFIVLSSCEQNKTAPDLLLINGKVWTGNDNAPFAEAVAISGNKILKTGSSVELKKMAGQHTVVIDLGGKLVTPGINDAHIHFLEGSLGLTGVNLYKSTTLAEYKQWFCCDHR